MPQGGLKFHFKGTYDLDLWHISRYIYIREDCMQEIRSLVSKENRNRNLPSVLYWVITDQYKSYTSALKGLKMDTLYNRRVKLCKKFAKKSAKNYI